MRQIVTALLLAGGWAAGRAGAESLDSLRVTAVVPAEFEYRFTAIVTPGSTNPVLSLNHRSGRTVFARAGEAVGAFRIRAFEPRSEEVFNPSINAKQTRPGGRVILSAADGSDAALDLDKPLPQPGWMAKLVSLESGVDWTVAGGDTFVFANSTATVRAIEESGVTVSADGADSRVPPISDAERTGLALRLAERRRAEQEARQQRTPVTTVDEPVRWAGSGGTPAGPRGLSVDLRSGPHLFMGTEMPYPVEFQVVPGVRNAAGQWIFPPIVLPSRFEWRGIGATVGGRQSSTATVGGTGIRVRSGSGM